MPSARPAHMFTRVTVSRRRVRAVSLPMITALIEPGSRYSANDPRDPVPVAPKPHAMPKPPRSTGKPGRPRKHRDEDDPEIAALLAVDDIHAPT